MFANSNAYKSEEDDTPESVISASEHFGIRNADGANWVNVFSFQAMNHFTAIFFPFVS